MRGFRLQVIGRVGLLVASALGAVLLWTFTGAYIAATVVGLTVLVQAAGLVRYVERTNRDVARFLDAVRYEDFAQSFPGGEGHSFAELHAAFRRVMDDFRQTRAEKEEHYRYLQTMMQHVGVGLIAFRPDGSVNLINTAAKRLLGVTRLAHLDGLRAWSEPFVETLLRLGPGQKGLVKVRVDDDFLELVVHATAFKLGGDHYTLVSVQNIQTELEEKEIEAWQKLTRVLTHEIMNSITPIASLAATASELMADDDGDDPETREDVQAAVQTIERRSRSLLGFVSAYRRLTRIPRPDFRIVPIAELFEPVAALLGPQFDAAGVAFHTQSTPPTLDVTCDPDLVEQVLINLLKNALEAVAGRGGAEVRMEAALQRGRVAVRIMDNGPGIDEEAMEKLFIPFFTTKPEGSGIGLSLSRQIMRAHGGTLSVQTEPDVQTIFTLRF